MADYRAMFEEQKLLNERNQRKIIELEAKQRLIESSYRSLRQLKQELTAVNKEAQFQNQQIHSFLSTFVPDYKLLAEPPPGHHDPKVFPDREGKLSPKSKRKEPKVQIVVDDKDDSDDNDQARLPMPSISYEWSDKESNVLGRVPSYLPRLGYTTYVGSSLRYGGSSRIKPDEELKLTLQFETASSELPTKLHLELRDESGNTVFTKRQNIYYVKLQEKLATLDCDKDYVLKVTSIQDDLKTNEEVVIHNKQFCDGQKQVAQPVKPKQDDEVRKIVIKQPTIEEVPVVPVETAPGLNKFKLADIQGHQEVAKVCLHSCDSDPDNGLRAKKVRRPVILCNKEEPEASKTIPKQVVLKKVLPELACTRWHHGFRHYQARYTRVSVMKLELHYNEDLHDLLAPRELCLELTVSSPGMMPDTGMPPCQLTGKVIAHKCFAEFVMFQEIPIQAQFALRAYPCQDVSDLEQFTLKLGQIQLNNWITHDFK